MPFLNSLSIIGLRRGLFPRRAKNSTRFLPAIEGKIGLEIGGPSDNFGDFGILPVYRRASRVDNCVFAAKTLWAANRPGEQSFQYHARRPPGFNYICEATDLSSIPNESYDFVLSSHSLEHIANPVKALREWIRVAKTGGLLILILPHRLYTFDRRRPPTSVVHMFRDYELRTDEADNTHFQEIIEMHDLALHPQRITHAELQAGILNNVVTRCAHHHVFDEINSRGLLEAVGFEVHVVEFVRANNIVLLAYVRK